MTTFGRRVVVITVYDDHSVGVDSDGVPLTEPEPIGWFDGKLLEASKALRHARAIQAFYLELGYTVRIQDENGEAL